MITVVGLGNDKNDLTLKGKKAIRGAEVLAVRTFLTPAGKAFKNKGAVSFDALFESCNDFNSLSVQTAQELIKLADSGKNVVYCVDGDGFSDRSVIELCRLLPETEIIQGVTDFGARTASSGAAVFDASEVISAAPFFDTNFALCVIQLDNALLAGDIKLYLLDFYAPSTQCVFSFNGKKTPITLEDLDRQKKYNFSASLFIPALEPFNKERYCFADLMNIMRRLTAHDGCEWDKAQTHSSIRINMIEEAYEAVDAIDSGDIGAMIEETGDVILQSVFHSDIARRTGEYTFNDVTDALCKKLVSRHTHIFGENKAENAADALNFWEKAKATEKNQKTLADSLDSLPSVFPAFLKTQKALKKAAKAGLKIDAQNLKAELQKAIEKNDAEKTLFYCTVFAVSLKADPEAELNNICRRFIEKCKKTDRFDLKTLEQMIE